MKLTLKATLLGTLCASSAVFAGGASNLSAPASVTHSTSSIYIEGMGGIVKDPDAKAGMDNSSPELTPGNWDNLTSAYTLGADIGYNFTKNWAVELGGFWTPKTKFKPNTNLYVKDTFIYLAAKLSVKVARKLDVYGKAGLGYQHESLSNALITDPTLTAFGHLDSSYNGWSPVFAVGASYHITSALTTSLQYMRFGQSFNTFSTTTYSGLDASDFFTLGLSYRFFM